MTQPTEDPVARADAIKAELFREMTLENTPAAAQDDRYTYDDDVYMSEGNRSAELEKELHDLYHSDPDAFRGSEYESWFAQPADPDRPDETFLDDDRYLDAEGPGDPFMDEESDADRALTDADLDATWKGHDPSVGRNLDDLANPDRYDTGSDLNPDVPDLTAPEAVPDTASFDELDAWWAEIGRSGDAGAADDYARDFQDTADHAAAGAEDADLARRDPEPG